MILCIVQARVSSTRLPEKVIKPILDKPMIIHELERLQRSKRIDKIVLATSREESDDALADVVSKNGVDVYRGDLDDVLDRYYQCAKEYTPKHVVRITGDCPAIDPVIVDAVIEKHLTDGNDYTATTERFPDGLDTEIFRFSALETAWLKARLLSEREHVTLYFKNNAVLFRMGQFECGQDLNGMRWTVDEPRDFEFMCRVYEALYPENPHFGMRDILGLLELHPEMLEINGSITRNEGLIKSLKSDRELGKEEMNHADI